MLARLLGFLLPAAEEPRGELVSRIRSGRAGGVSGVLRLSDAAEEEGLGGDMTERCMKHASDTQAELVDGISWKWGVVASRTRAYNELACW